MRRLAAVLPVLALLGAATPAAAAPTGRLLVTLAPRAGAIASASSADGIALAHAARVSGPRVPEIGLLTVSPAPGASAARTAAALRRDPRVRAVAPEQRASLRLLTDDPGLLAPSAASGGATSAPPEWWAPRSGFPQAWDIVRGTGATVAIIDTGVDAQHPEIAPQLRASADFDDDPGSGPATVDENGHGTHVASIACATPGNAIGIAGAGMGCGLIIEKTDLRDASIAAAIVDAVKRGADAINMSFGTDGRRPASDAVVRAIDYAYRHDVVLVAAAADRPASEQGDPANVLQPAGTGADPTAGRGLSVTAATISDRRAPFAGRGSEISMAAYGATGSPSGAPGLLGAFPSRPTQLERGGAGQPACECRTTFGGSKDYAYLQGTSMAAPQVAATAALVRTLNPDLHAADVIALLKRSARRPPGSGWSPELGWGILDAEGAVRAARRIDRTAPASHLQAPGPAEGGTVVLRLRGEDIAPPGVPASGVAHYEIWRRVGGGAPQRVARTTSTVLRVPLVAGARNAFFTVAVDRAANRERRPRRADAAARIVAVAG